MVMGSSIARLKKRAQKAFEKAPENRSYKETKDVSNWTAVTERWEAMRGNQYARGLMRTEETLEKMRSSQLMRRKREFSERMRKVMRNLEHPVSSED
jgi:hypothetical protein